MTDLRIIPSIEILRRREGIRGLEREFGRAAIVDALRAATAELRARLSAEGAGPGCPDDAEAAARAIEEGARQRLEAAGRPSLCRLINATGIVVHTNLGRAPLAEAATRRMAELGRGYTNLEFDIEQGRRGRRDVHAEALLTRLLGADSAVVVNNNAGATLLVLAALAAGREVVVSRGELVEIGGGFRLPEVMAQSGARLREVGTTNRTRADDYDDAIGPDTALLLRVHQSNFRIEGFTERPTLDQLVEIGRRRKVAVAEDIGSGYLGLGREEDAARLDALLGGEPRVEDSLARGVDVICFSGDKLLGGPQAGIIAGRRPLLDRIRRHPLMRVLRVDKLTYAALEATLAEYAAGRASRTVPVIRMILAAPGTIEARARALAERAAAAGVLEAVVVATGSKVGGGTTPGVELPSSAVALSHRRHGADWLDGWLRRHDPGIVGRIDDDRLLLDMRTVLDEEDETVARALAGVPA
jgi:L-seryl-tRNA(Ser) seleniumtransferase